MTLGAPARTGRSCAHGGAAVQDACSRWVAAAAGRGRALGGNLAQDAAHDLAGARLGQAGRPVDDIRRRDRPNDLAHRRDQLLLQRRRRRVLGALRVRERV